MQGLSPNIGAKMSHRATNWLSEIDPKSLTNAEFRVLFVLCDCHNPSRGCFPKQSYIIEKTGRGSSSVNDALSRLEANGFIRREKREDSSTHQRKSTNYILCFDVLDAQEPTPLNGDGANSGFPAKPSPVFRQSHLLKTGVHIEPVNEPVNEPVFDNTHKSDFQIFFEESPRGGDEDLAYARFVEITEGGVDPKAIISAISAYAKEQAGNEMQYVRFAENFLSKNFWKSYADRSTSDGSNRAAQDAEKIRSHDAEKNGPIEFNAIMAGVLIDSNLITRQECQRAGIDL